MIKTVLLNILDVSKDCQVPPSYIGTFMGYVIGAQAKFDLKKPERQQAFLSGEHDPKDLSKIFLNFIMEVLLCPNCGLPEISIVPEQKSVYGTCRACGSHSELKINDEKFKRYVINHPPSLAKSAFDYKEKTGVAKKDKGKEKEDEKPAEKVEKKDEPEKPKKVKGKKEEEEVVWFSDTSEAATRKRREEMLPDSMNAADKKGTEAANNDDELTKELIEAVKLGVDAVKDVKSKKSNVDEKVFLQSLLLALFPNDCDFLAEAKAKSNLVQKFITGETAQLALLAFIEQFCGVINTSQLSKVPLVLKEFYDKDLLEEENILRWHEKEKTNAIASVRDQAAPMIKWLKEAEEESDGEEEEEEDS